MVYHFFGVTLSTYALLKRSFGVQCGGFTGVSSRFGPPEVVNCGDPKAFAHCIVVKKTTFKGWLLERQLQFSPKVTFYSAFISTEDDTWTWENIHFSCRC